MNAPETRKPGGNRDAPARPSAQALQVLEGERLAAEFLEALRDTAGPPATSWRCCSRVCTAPA